MQNRSQWGSRLGFILAAAGSAVGLGNLWKFPYVTGNNGGGLFVILYLLCVALVGLPVMMAEILLGRSSQTSTVGAFREMNEGKKSGWMGIGFMGVACAFIILSYYSVVAGWTLHYLWLSLTGEFGEATTVDTASKIFGDLYASGGLNAFWHLMFMAATVGIVFWGVQKGVERAARILMPALFFMLVALLIYAMTLDGFGQALEFVFAPDVSKITASGVLEALGQAFFSLSLGMGAMLTYGSYLSKKDDLPMSAVQIGLLDTGVALMASMVLFPITFTFALEPAQTVGLVFINIPFAFSQLPGGTVWATLFFGLLVFAALSSTISLMEVAASYFIDEKGFSRRAATLMCGGIITALGIPSALSGAPGFFNEGMTGLIGKNWFDSFDYLAANIMLPLGGMGIAVFTAWKVGDEARRTGFVEGSSFGVKIYAGWLVLLRYLVPVAILLVFLHAIGVLDAVGLGQSSGG